MYTRCSHVRTFNPFVSLHRSLTFTQKRAQHQPRIVTDVGNIHINNLQPDMQVLAWNRSFTKPDFYFEDIQDIRTQNVPINRLMRIKLFRTKQTLYTYETKPWFIIKDSHPDINLDPHYVYQPSKYLQPYNVVVLYNLFSRRFEYDMIDRIERDVDQQDYRSQVTMQYFEPIQTLQLYNKSYTYFWKLHDFELAIPV